MAPPPKILVITDACISPAHGTGTLVLRHFSSYPATSIMEAYRQRVGEPSFANSQRYSQSTFKGDLKNGFLSLFPRLYNLIISRLGLFDFYYHRSLRFMPEPGPGRETEAPPDLIYSVVYSQAGLALVDQILSDLPVKVPLIQYFLDYQFTPGFRANRYLKKVLAQADEVWALTDEIASAINPAAKSLGRDVRIQPGFHMDVPNVWKQAGRSGEDPEFACVICGNFWMPEMALMVKRVWARVRQNIPSLKPVKWYCHPESAERTRQAAGEFAPEIQVMGFFSGAALGHELLNSDMAIVPFNINDVPENDYARYSLPSRLTELLALGLPVFCIAGANTPVARYVRGHNIGTVGGGENEDQLVRMVTEFIQNQKERSQMGRRARNFAEREFALPPFQKFLHAKLGSLAGQGRPASWKKSEILA